MVAEDFLASRGMGEAQGKKVTPPPLRQDDRGAAVLWADQAIKRPPRRVPDGLKGEDMVDKGAVQEAATTGRRNGNLPHGNGSHRTHGLPRDVAVRTPKSVG
jgi:hypothetical protein